MNMRRASDARPRQQPDIIAHGRVSNLGCSSSSWRTRPHGTKLHGDRSSGPQNESQSLHDHVQRGADYHVGLGRPAASRFMIRAPSSKRTRQLHLSQCESQVRCGCPKSRRGVVAPSSVCRCDVLSVAHSRFNKIMSGRFVGDTPRFLTGFQENASSSRMCTAARCRSRRRTDLYWSCFRWRVGSCVSCLPRYPQANHAFAVRRHLSRICGTHYELLSMIVACRAPSCNKHVFPELHAARGSGQDCCFGFALDWAVENDVQIETRRDRLDQGASCRLGEVESPRWIGRCGQRHVMQTELRGLA